MPGPNVVQIADSVRSVISFAHPLARAAADRSVAMTPETVDLVINQSVFDWRGRNPVPALTIGGELLKAGGLDLASFLVPLAARGAVIEIPEYVPRRQIVLRENERKIGTNNFGRIRGLVSNQKALSFSVRIMDETIAVTGDDEREELGARRNYMIVDVDGLWNEGWSSITFKPTAAENRFLYQKGLIVGDSLPFQNWVDPNRYQSFFGAPYLLAKMLVMRLADEGSILRAEEKRLADAGFVPVKPVSVWNSNGGGSKTIDVNTFEAELDMPEFMGRECEYFNDAPAKDGLDRAEWMYGRRKLVDKLRAKAQFVVRADEAAYYLYANKRKAPWAKGLKLEENVRAKGARISWNRFKLSDDASIRFRTFVSREKVAA